MDNIKKQAKSKNDFNLDNNDYSKSHFTTENIYEYLKFCHKNGSHKLAGIITNKQRLFNIARGSDHWTLTYDMLKEIYPDRQYGWQNPFMDGITIYSTGNNLVVDLPLRISRVQYESVLRMIDQAHQFEKDFDTKLDYFYDDYIKKQAKKRLSDVKANDSDEVIIGVPLTEELPNELFEETKQEERGLWSSWDDELPDNFFDTFEVFSDTSVSGENQMNIYK